MPPRKKAAEKDDDRDKDHGHEPSPERAKALAAALRPYDDPLAKAILADLGGDRPGKFWGRNGDRVLDLLVRLLDRTTARDGG
jgi:hypothetical protein